MKRNKQLLFVILLLCTYSVFAQYENSVASDSSLIEPVSQTISNLSFFENDNQLKISLKYDITSFIRHKSKGEYLDAEMHIHVGQTDSILKNIRLKARGSFRRRHCFFPPIYLNLKTDPIETGELAGIKKIKLVTHCSSAKQYRNYVLREYLAYRIFNILTDNSFRVKLLNISYVDTGKKQRNYTQIGFIIEPLDLLIKRTNSMEVNPQNIRGINVARNETNLVAIFNYMIGNTDWRIRGGHNMKYIKAKGVASVFVTPVPYDFDYSGFVGASYAIPQEWSGVNNVREREYLGYCPKYDDEFLNNIRLFQQKKGDIYNEIQSFTLLDEKERKKILNYLDDFYELVERPDVFMSVLKRQCRSIDF